MTELTLIISSGRVYPIMRHVARFHAVRPLCLSEYHVEGVMVLKCPFSRVMTLSDGVFIVFISLKGRILSLMQSEFYGGLTMRLSPES